MVSIFTAAEAAKQRRNDLLFKHLPGQHNQMSHGRGGGGVSLELGSSDALEASKRWLESMPGKQRASIERWTKGDQSKIRLIDKGGILKDWKEHKKWRQQTENMREALETAPKVTGTVYRGLSVRESELGAFITGAEVKLEAMSGASPDESTAACFAGNFTGKTKSGTVSILLEIRSKGCTDITLASDPRYHWQKEHILSKGSVYKVLSISPNDEEVTAHWNETEGRDPTNYKESVSVRRVVLEEI